MTISDTDRAVARAARDAFAGSCTVRRYWDDPELVSADILCSDDSSGELCWSTVGLYHRPQHLEGRSIATELAFIGGADAGWGANLVASSAFRVIKDGWLAAPGVVFPDAVAEYEPGTQLPHLLWVPPFPFPELASVVVTDDVTVHWLLGMAISDGERDYLDDHGFDALEHAFEAGNVDYRGVARTPLFG
jgi:hypothetical protein